MKNNVLLKNLLLSTSIFNMIRTEKDKKKRGKAIGSVVGKFFLYLMLLCVAVFVSIGYAYSGLTSAIPVFCCVLLAVLEFVFTIFKTNGYLFAFKDYDMLMSLPFSVKKVVSSKFLYMYIKNLPMVFVVSLAMEISYGIFAKPPIAVYFIWTLLSFLLPMIPMVLASVVGFFIAAAGSKTKHKSFVQIVLTILVILAIIVFRVVFESMLRNNQYKEMMDQVSGFVESVKNVYFPAQLFENAILKCSILDTLIFILVSLGIFEIAFLVISRFYRQINSRLITSGSSKNFKMSNQKKHGVVFSVAYKELKRFTSSANYFVNAGMGQILVLLISIAVIFIDLDKILLVLTNGAPVTKDILLPGIPMIVFWLVGMMATTTVSVSLEGKNFWIIQSSPISMADFYRGKMFFNLWVTVPFALLGNIALGVACGGAFADILLCCVTGILQCFFSTTMGMACGLRFARFDWENEMEIIKQNTGVVLYLLPNMFISMILTVVFIALGFLLPADFLIVGTGLIYGLVGAVFYFVVMNKAKNSAVISFH